jgi:hypothetical protein
MRGGFWKKDWFFGLMMAGALASLASSPAIQGFERAAYDWGVKASCRSAGDKIVVIAIDEPSIRNSGRWPRSRDIQAKTVDNLADANAKKVMANLVFLSEPQADPGLLYIRNLDLSERMPVLSLGAVRALLHDAEQFLGAARKLGLADSYGAAGTVVLPIRALATFLEKAMAEDGDHRNQTGEEFAAALGVSTAGAIGVESVYEHRG